MSNDTANSLANISLRWMVREAVSAACGIKFDEAALARASINIQLEPTTEEIELDNADALEPLHDELKANPLWWLLEIIPLQYSWQDANGVWHREWKYVAYKYFLSSFSDLYDVHLVSIWVAEGRLWTHNPTSTRLLDGACNHH